jgi:hypothetical protein
MADLITRALMKLLLLMTPHYVSFCQFTLINMLNQPSSWAYLLFACSPNRRAFANTALLHSQVAALGASINTIHGLRRRSSLWHLKHHPSQVHRLLPPTSSILTDFSLGRRRNPEVYTSVCTAHQNRGKMDTRVTRGATCVMPIHL